MEVPILKQGPYLIASIQSALSDNDMVRLRDALVEQVGRFRSRGVIVDVTALDVMDSFATRTLRDLGRMIRLRGADTVIVGIQPEVAYTMVQLGLTLEDIATALDLEEGLALLERKTTAPSKEKPAGSLSRPTTKDRVSQTFPAPLRPGSLRRGVWGLACPESGG